MSKKTLVPALVTAVLVTLVVLSASADSEWGIPEEELVSPTHSISLRQKVEISSELLASSAFLWTQRDSRGQLLPGNGKVDKPKDRAAYQLHDKASVSPIGKTSYKLGDTVDIINPIKFVSFRGKTANLVKPTGKAVVEGFSGNRIVIKLIQMWDVVQGGERIIPSASFKAIPADSLVAPDKNIQANVVARVDETVAPYLHQMFIIDRGSGDGIRLGDHFTVFENQAGNSTSSELLVGHVINVSPSSSTLVILKLFRSRLEAGDQAFLSRRILQQ